MSLTSELNAALDRLQAVSGADKLSLTVAVYRHKTNGRWCVSTAFVNDAQFSSHKLTAWNASIEAQIDAIVDAVKIDLLALGM